MYTHIPRGPTDLILIYKTHNVCSTYSFSNVMFMLNISHTMQHVVGCPTWEDSHPNRCRVSKWEHGHLNRCSVSKMRTWFSNSMFHLFPKMEHGLTNRCWISNMGTCFAKSMLDFQKWEHGFQNRCWMSTHTLGSNNGFKQWVQTMGSNRMRCTSLE